MGRTGMLSGIDEIDVRDAPLPGAGIGRSLMRFSEHAFRIRGRASRSEYWWWMLVHAGVVAALTGAVPAVSGASDVRVVIGPLGGLFADLQLFQLTRAEAPVPEAATIALIGFVVWSFSTLVPGATVAIRRLHDSDLAGWWVLLALVPLGGVVLFALLARRPRPGGSRFDC